MSSRDSVRCVEDAELVAALRAGNSDAFGKIYDRYADRLFTYAVTLVKDHDTANDVVHDAFLIAHARIEQLRDPSRLRSWLYAITRTEALRTLRGARRTTELDAAGDVMDTTVNLDADLNAMDARTLVLAALAGLNAGDREVIELSLRHELDTAETARSLGVSSSHASALVSRAKTQFERALTAVVLLRTRGRDCDALAALIADSDDDALTPLLRKRIARHVDDCEVCERVRRGAVAAMPAIGIALPFLAAPRSLRDQMMSTIKSGATSTKSEEIVERSGPFDHDGFPVVPATRRRRRTIALALAAGLVVLIGAGAIALGASNTTEASTPNAIGLAVRPTPTTTTTTPRSASPSTAPAIAPAPSNDANADTADPAPSLAPAPAPVPQDRTPATVAFSFVDLDDGECPVTFTARVSATAIGASVKSVTALWLPINGGSGSGDSVAMTRTGASRWRADISGIPTQQENVLRIRAVTTSGVVTLTPTSSLEHICPG